jgi:iron complex outermembrane receptor protein
MRKITHTRLSQHIWLAFGGSLISMGAIQAAQAQSDTVYVTGSAIKRSLESQKALPVSVYSVEELKSVGVTSTEEIVQRITASQSSMGGSQSVGSGTGGRSNADMRGLGASKTLVLLNGRRLAFFGIGSDTVDLNSIPFAALEKVEVLRDGASAIYGTDAVGGVINFITKRDYQGINVATELTQPSASGGKSQRVTVSGGKGSLSEDGYNLWFSVDSKKQNSVSALERDFAKTGVIPEKGLSKTSGTTFPANFGYYRLSDGKQLSGNLTATNCAPPSSIYMSGTTCRYDYTSAIDIIPETENTNVMGKGSFRLGGDQLLTLEAVHSSNKNISRTAPDPVTGLTMPISSPFYPKTFSGIDPSRGLVSIAWRMEPAGRRENTAESTSTRLVADLSGTVGEWDYKAGVYHSINKISESLTNGYVNKSVIQTGINSGLLNPFGTNTTEALKYIDGAKAVGLMSTGKGTATGVDARFNRELFAMDGGKAAISLGGEFRREGYSTDTVDDVVNNVPSAGRSPYHVSNASRNVTAISAEMLLPVSKQLELQAAARYDHYSDFGSTFNPKVGFRYTASPELVLRGSANTGFRAPSLDNVFGPQQVTFTQNDYNDPVLCPNGVPTANAVESRDCGSQAQAKQGGNRNLKPEKSQSFSLGTAFQPAKNLLFTMDYWNIKLDNYIATFPEQAVFGDPTKYANRFIRCSQVSAAEASSLSRCDIAGSPALAYIMTLTDNLGSVRTDGLDFTAAWQTDTGLGRVNVNYEGTYVHSYKFQREAGGTFTQNAGAYKDFIPGVVFRWKHNVTTTLATGDMRYSLGMRYLSGYQDENLDPDFINRVPAYTVFDLGASYTGIKNLTIAAVMRNLLDVKPPFSNQGSTFQQGYDPRYTDALGRALVMKLNYKFF